jgi:GT2 family glycosyltransferase
MKLSIVVLCWNDRGIIGECLRSICTNSHACDYEVIVCDNGSTDGSVGFIRSSYPAVQVIENGKNLRFAKANNVGIGAACGEYTLILNPDTIIGKGTLDMIVSLADRHPEAGAFGCRVLNADLSYQISARPFASLHAEWIAALCLRRLGHLHEWFAADSYPGWNGMTERRVDWISGCFMLVRSDLLRSLGGFDERFFYYYEDMDLCRRIWESGHSILYSPTATIVHLGGRSTKTRFPALGFLLDSQVTRYLYYYKYSGRRGVRRARHVALVATSLRLFAYRVKELMHPTVAGRERMDCLRALVDWNYRVDPIRLVELGEEPSLRMVLTTRVCER